MFRSTSPTFPTLLALALAALVLAGCGAASTTTTAGRSAGAAPSPLTSRPIGAASASAAASTSPASTGSAAVSPSTSADPLNLPHVDAALENLLPSRIGGVDLFKMSLTLQDYVASTPGAGTNALYLPWLVKFGKTPADATIAIATDLTEQENFFVQGIEVPGATAAALLSGFGDAAKAAGWPVKSHTNWGSTGKSGLEVSDPVAEAAGKLFDAFVYAKDDVLYAVVTDDQSLVVEALIKLP
jgi:hypothetical protein